MFDWTDLDKFIISFFIILPIVTIIHQFGHFFFAKIFGGITRYGNRDREEAIQGRAPAV
ncbi:putative membrane ywmF domain protein [Exiguobacterium sp. S17]|nr:putative membrane ywmF domain protein [Exiguobacterium sp. S17]